jgi:hypothetical protein
MVFVEKGLPAAAAIATPAEAAAPSRLVRGGKPPLYNYEALAYCVYNFPEISFTHFSVFSQSM